MLRSAVRCVSSLAQAAAARFELNSRSYSLPPRPVAVVCLDGCEDDYFATAMAHGKMPSLQRFYTEGFRGLAQCALPSFTNPNNVSIVTGVPPSAHGISGNYFFDQTASSEVMMNERRFMQAETVLKAAEDHHRKVAVITAKHKLHPLLSSDLTPGKSIFFSVEKTSSATEEDNGLDSSAIRQLYRAPGHGTQNGLPLPDVPDIYSANASIFLLRAGAGLVRQGKADFLYLSTTDFMQHKFAPSSPESLDFYSALDDELGNLFDAGALVGVTADHGMNSKVWADSSPRVLYLSQLLQQAGLKDDEMRILLPITDPYVKHHGSLGGFATIYLQGDAADRIATLQQQLLMTDGISECYTRHVAAAKLELPLDRIGDLVLLGDRHTVFGKSPADHELHEVSQGLRSHGSRYEQMVPFILSHPLQERWQRRAEAGLRNFDIFEATTSWTVAA